MRFLYTARAPYKKKKKTPMPFFITLFCHFFSIMVAKTPNLIQSLPLE